MSVEDLCAFYEREISDAKQNDILLSLVRDHPIIHARYIHFWYESVSLIRLFAIN
jgi:monomeric isocitrate dehydrogenase